MNTGLIVESISWRPCVQRLSEAGVRPEERSYFYLIETETRACLIDSGWGLGWTTAELPLLQQCRTVIAIASHSHVDHIGMFGAFTNRLAHGEEAAVYASPDHRATQAWPYLEDRALLSDGDGRIDLAAYQIAPAPLTGTLSDGDVVELQGARLEVIHTPGHSVGSISLRCPEAGLLFTADVLHAGPIYDDIPGASRVDVLNSHRRLSALEFDRVAPGHGPMLSRGEALARIATYRDLPGGVRPSTTHPT